MHTRLTAAQWPHLSVLRVDLGDVGHAFAQHVHGDLIAVLIHPVSCFISRPLNLRLAVGWREEESEKKKTFPTSALKRRIYKYKNEQNTSKEQDKRIYMNGSMR